MSFFRKQTLGWAMLHRPMLQAAPAAALRRERRLQSCGRRLATTGRDGPERTLAGPAVDVFDETVSSLLRQGQKATFVEYGATNGVHPLRGSSHC